MATMPRVVPAPSHQTSAVLWRTVSTVRRRWVRCGSATNTTMTITLFTAGASAAAANRRRALSIALTSAANP